MSGEECDLLIRSCDVREIVQRCEGQIELMKMEMMKIVMSAQ